MNRRLAATLPFALIAACAFAAYLRPAWRVLQLNPDVVEYLDVARRLNGGEGYVLGVKAYHTAITPVIHDGLSERAPLYTFLVAGLLKLGGPLWTLQIANAVLAAACAALVGAITAQLAGARAGWIAMTLAAMSPVVLARLIPPMSEALSIALSLAAVWLAPRCRRSPWVAVVAGAMLGLAYLARPTALVLVPALMLGLWSWRRAVGVLGGALLVIAPASFAVLLTRGRLSYSGQTYLYSVLKDAEVLRQGYGRELPSPAEFIVGNLGLVIWGIIENAIDYATLMFRESDWMLPLIPAMALGAIVASRSEQRARWSIPMLATLANYAVYAATWANFQERYQILTMLLLIPAAATGLASVSTHRVGLALAVVYVAIVGYVWLPTWREEYRDQFRYGDEPTRARVDRGIRWTGPPRWVQDNDLDRLLEWVEGRTSRHESLALGQPWPVTFFTTRPTTLLPTRLSPESLRRFIGDYRLDFVAVDSRDRDRRDYIGVLESWSSEGVRPAAVGAYRIFDVRGLSR